MTAFDGVHETACNATQYQQSQQFYSSGSPWISCLTHGDIIGLVLVAEASLLSCLCVVVIFIRIGWNVHWYKKVFPNGDWALFQSPSDTYMFFLFVFDFLQTISGILNIRWAHKGIVMTGPYCTAQGILEQIGGLGVALNTLLLAIHVFSKAVLSYDLKPRGVAFTLVCLACVFIIIWAAIDPDIDKNYETPTLTPYWCWISPQYLGEWIRGEYIWLWITLFASVILYIPLYFWAAGFWSVDEEYSFHWWIADQRVGYAQRRSTLGMLLYPLAYSLIILPISITRWLQFSKHHVSSTATFFANSMFYLSGAIHVLLFLIFTPALLLFPRPKELDESDMLLAQDTQDSPVITSDTTRPQHSPEPTSIAGLSRDIATPSRQISNDI